MSKQQIVDIVDSTDNSIYISGKVQKPAWLYPLLSHPKLRRLLSAAIGLMLGVPSIFLTLWGTSLMETSMIIGHPWGNGRGMVMLFTGLALYAAVTGAAGILSATAYIPMILVYLIIGFSHILQRLPMLWQVSMSVGWSSYMAMMLGGCLGSGYSVYKSRRTNSYKSGIWFTWNISRSRSARLLTGLVGAMACLAIILFTGQQAGYLEILTTGEVVNTSRFDPFNFSITALLGLAAFLVTVSAMISVWDSAFSSILFLVLPSIVISAGQLFSLGEDSLADQVGTWSISSPVLGVVGTVLAISSLATTWATHFPSMR